MEDRLFEFVLEGDGAPDHVAGFGTDLDVANGELGCVEDDPVHRFVHRDIDGHGPREAGGADVRLDLYAVGVWLHGPGQTERILVGRRWGQWGR